MQNNKQILKLLLASTAAAVVVSCGSGSSDKSDPEPSSTSTPSATTTPAPTMTSTPTQSPTPTGTSTPTPTQTPAPSNTATPAPTGTSSVTIDPLTHQFYGNSGSLDRKKYFVMHGNLGGSSEINVDELAALKERFDLYQGRQFWSPLSQPVVKSSLDKDQGYPATTTAVSLGQKVIAADNKNPKLPYVSNRLVVTDQPRSPLHKNNDPVEGARWAADYFTHYFDDTTRPLFYEPMNEPFVHAGDFKAEHGPEEANVRAYMTTWFNEIGKEFDKRPELANVNVIGFASAWPSMELWDFNHWRDRMKMFMDNAGPNIDSFSVHLYDGVNIVGADSERTGSNSQAILDLIETYSAFKWDVVKPHSITEYGAIVKRPNGEKEYNEQVNSQTVRSFNGIMMELMERDDRLLTSIPFITDHSTWFWQNPSNDGHPYNPAMWRPNRNNIQLSSDKKRWEFKDPKAQDNYLLNANHLFFEFWKDVRGLRIAVDNLDPDLQVAAFIDGPTAYIVLNNLEHVAKNIQLNLAEMLGYDFSRVEIERLTVPRDAGANLKTEDITANGDVDGKPLSFGSLTMTAGEAVKFTITLDKPISPDNALKRATYYSDTHLQTIAANQAIDFKIDNVDISSTDASSSTAMLRMSISRKHARSKQPTLTVNGTAVSVPGDWAGYDQADRDDFFGSIDIPVAFDLLTEGTNTVSVTFPDSSGRVSSMILEVNKPSEPVALASIDLGGDTTLSHDGVKQLNAKLIPTGASTALTWTSSDNAIVKVNKNGFLTAVSEGTATVTAVATNSVSASISVTVNPKPTSKTGNLLENSDPEFESAINNDLLMERTGGSQTNVAMFEQRAGIGEAGTGGLFVNNTAGSLKLLYTDAALIDDVDTTKTYRIEFRAKVVSGEHVFWSQIPGSTGWKSKALTVTPDWQTVFIEYSGTGLPEGFTVPIHLDPAPSKQGGEVHIDNVKFYAVN